jgi:LPS export ABC transporter protein LptC
MVLVACGALLSACQEPKAPPIAKAGALPDSAQQMLFGVDIFLTDAGVRRAKLHADTMLLYNENTRAELKHVNSDFYTTTGERNATLTALEGTYQVRVQGMEARRNVVVVSTDGRKLATQQLKFDQARNEISSDSAFTLTKPDGVVKGIGFVSDPAMNHITILRSAKIFGQSVKIPKR